MIRTRFAPNPNGLLHVGNARIAIISWLFTKEKKGEYILRIDNTEKNINQKGFIEKIKQDLKWLGIKWDKTFQQSNRRKKYEKITEYLIQSGRLYPCFETEKELQSKREEQIKRKVPPIYDRSAKLLCKEKIVRLKKEGKKPHWRFFINSGTISWYDKIRGKIEFQTKKLSDPILIKSNKEVTYLLASVIDDIDYKITDIIRGADHISNSAIQIQIFEALNKRIPNLAHLPLLFTGAKKISKKNTHSTIRNLKKRSIHPNAIKIYLSRIGFSDSINCNYNTHEGINKLKLQRFNNSDIQYCEKNVIDINTKIIRNMTFESIKKIVHNRYKGMNFSEKMWSVIKHNIKNTSEVAMWIKIFNNKRRKKVRDRHILKISLKNFPKNKMNSDAYHQWIDNIEKITNKKRKEILITLRIFLTGIDKGPSMLNIINVIKGENVKNQLKEQIYKLN